MDKFIEFKKRDAKRQVVLGLVYAPMVLDTQGDFATPEVIEKAAYSFSANGKSAAIDIEHDGKACGARVVECYLAKKNDPDFSDGSWILGTWCPDEIWADVEAGRLNGFSMTGRGQRVAKALDGVAAHEILDLSVSGVSLVNRPANKTQFAVRKADEMPAWAKAVLDSVENLKKEIDALERSTKVAKSRGRHSGFRNVEKPRDEAADIRKAVETEHLAKTALETRALVRRHAVITEKLHRVWEAGGPRAALVEQGLLAELEKTEIELSAIRGTVDTFDVDSPGRSAFHQRGGQSFTGNASRVFQGGDSYYAPKRDAKVRKAAEDALDLNFLKI